MTLMTVLLAGFVHAAGKLAQGREANSLKSEPREGKRVMATSSAATRLRGGCQFLYEISGVISQISGWAVLNEEQTRTVSAGDGRPEGLHYF